MGCVGVDWCRRGGGRERMVDRVPMVRADGVGEPTPGWRIDRGGRLGALLRLAHAVVRGAGQSAEPTEALRHLGQALDRVDLPRQVVKPDRAARRAWRIGADLE